MAKCSRHNNSIGGRSGSARCKAGMKRSRHVLKMLLIKCWMELARFGVEAAHQRNEFAGVASDHFYHRPQERVHDLFER